MQIHKSNSSFKTLLAASGLFLFAGCAGVPYNNLKRTATIPEGQGVVILGIKGASRIDIQDGTVVDNRFVPKKPASYGISAQQVDGYAVVPLRELENGKTYGITTAWFSIGLLGICNWRQAITFEVEKGKVTYIGDLDFTVRNEIALVETVADPGRALSHIKENFPQLPRSIQYVRPQSIGTCSAPTNEGKKTWQTTRS